MADERGRDQPDDAGTIQTRLSSIDGEAGELLIGGYPVEHLAGRATYEESIYLLWEGALPNADQLAGLKRELGARRDLPPIILEVLRAAANQGLAPIDALRSAASLLDLIPKSAESAGGDTPPARETALTVVAAFPTIIAAYARLLDGQKPVPPRAHLGHAANFLYMLDGREASRERVEALESYLVTVIDHGVSASTFAARVIVSTGSDLLSAVVGGVGALKGPLHGGAPGLVLDMLLGIGEATRAESYLRAKLTRGERLMGFGHRDYRVRDPRAVVLDVDVFAGRSRASRRRAGRQF